MRRHFYPQSSPAGQGAVWQWSGDKPGDWHMYDMCVQCVIEESWGSVSIFLCGLLARSNILFMRYAENCKKCILGMYFTDFFFIYSFMLVPFPHNSGFVIRSI